MTQKNIYISENDLTRVRLLLASLQGDPRSRKAVENLREEVDRAIVMPELPAHAIGLLSTAEILDLESGEVDRFTLTLPEQADSTRGRLSILAPLGTAIFGFSEGDEFAWRMPGGIRRLRIQRVNQPAETTAPAVF